MGVGEEKGGGGGGERKKEKIKGEKNGTVYTRGRWGGWRNCARVMVVGEGRVFSRVNLSS